jgi:hypothetical protein
MFRVRRTAALCVTIFAVMLSIGCGSGSSSQAMSQAQAQAVAGAFSMATSDALSGSFSGSASGSDNDLSSNVARPLMSTVLRDIRPDTASGCTSTANGESCSFPVSANDSPPCTGGGTIAVTGTISGNISNSGSGSLSAQVTLTPQNCAVDGVVVNGGTPPVTGTGSINLTDSAPVYPIVITESGDINFGLGSCPVSLTYTSTANGCTMTGNACGSPITGTC